MRYCVFLLALEAFCISLLLYKNIIFKGLTLNKWYKSCLDRIQDYGIWSAFPIVHPNYPALNTANKSIKSALIWFNCSLFCLIPFLALYPNFKNWLLVCPPHWVASYGCGNSDLCDEVLRKGEVCDILLNLSFYWLFVSSWIQVAERATKREGW